MRREEFFDKCIEHKHALLFAAGIATAIVGKKVLESKTAKDAATKGMASVMSIRRDAEECFEDKEQKGEDIVGDGNGETKKEIYGGSKG